MDSIAEGLKNITDQILVLTFGHHVVQKAHVFVKYQSSTPSCDDGRGFDDPRPGTEQDDQGTKRTPVNREKLQEALCWQPPQEAAVDGQADLNRKWADIRHLEQIVEMVSPGTSIKSAVMSFPSPYFSSQMQGRSASSFRSYSRRCTPPGRGTWYPSTISLDYSGMSHACVFECVKMELQDFLAGLEVTYCVQVDLVDLHTRHSTSTLGKRVIGGTAVDSLGQLSPRFRRDTSGGKEPFQAKIPKVRFHKRDSRYIAQVKPRGASGSVHIAQFETLPEAARARDVGWYFYHRDSSIRMHFDDTPHLILTELASTGRNAEDELSRIAGLSGEEKLKFVRELAKKIVQAHHPVELPSSLPRYPKMMRTSMRADISQNRVQVTEQPLGGESSGFTSSRSCPFELSELRETTSKFSDSWINEDGGTLSTDAEQRWLSSVILEDTSAASTLQLRSPHQLQIDQMDQHVGISTEASELEAPDLVGDMTLEYMWEGQDLWQPSVGHGTFGSRDYALSMTNQAMNRAESPSQVWSPGEDYSLWQSKVQATAVNVNGGCLAEDVHHLV